MTNPLTDAIPTKYRRAVYAVVFVIGLAITAWQASDGNWRVAVSTFIASLVPLLAHANANDPEIPGD
jgi:uncharacterized membrane protein